MAKIRLTMIATKEYEVNPEHYTDECDTTEKKAQLDKRGYEDDIFMFIDNCDKISIDYEIIEE